MIQFDSITLCESILSRSALEVKANVAYLLTFRLYWRCYINPALGQVQGVNFGRVEAAASHRGRSTARRVMSWKHYNEALKRRGLLIVGLDA